MLHDITIYGDAETAARINAVVAEFPRLFTDDGKMAKIPEEDWLSIPLQQDWDKKGAKLAHKVYPLGPKERQLVDEVHNKMHHQGKMEWSTGSTPFGFPVFVAWRNVDGQRKGRVVVDIRGLNKVTVHDSYPMPLQTDITSAVAGCKYISVNDATSFFYQMRVKNDERHKIAVVSHRGREQYNVAPMGYSNSPAYAQRQSDTILQESGCNKFTKAYMDDFITSSETLDDHIEHLRATFKALDDRDITLSGKKSFLGFPSVHVLGQLVDGLGLSTAEDKIEAIRAIQFPKSLKDLETYLGMTGWHRHHIGYYAQLAAPLQKRKTEALKGAPTAGHARKSHAGRTRIDETAELLDSFNGVQGCFGNTKILVHFNRERPLFIFVDASKQRGFGVQVAHVKGDQMTTTPTRTNIEPILFLSKTLSAAESRYWPTELEVACLVWTIRRIRWMVEAAEHPVTIFTDHAATTGIAQQTSLTSSLVDRLNIRLIRASQYLSQFQNLKFVHVPGREHIVPDALSRLEARESGKIKQNDDVLEDLMLSYVVEAAAEIYYSTTSLNIKEDFKKELSIAYDADKTFSRIKAIAQSEPGTSGFEWRDDLLWKGNRLCIPKALVGDVLEIVHDNQFHIGFHRMYPRVAEHYFIHKLEKRLRTYVRHCSECQRLQTKRYKPYGSLQPIQSPPIPFHTIAIDFIVGLPHHDGCNSLMTATCKFSKRILLIPGHDQLSAEAWLHLLLDALMTSEWGMPSTIIADRDRKFMSAVWRTLFNRLGTKLLHSTAYHPQTDGQSERTNQIVEIALRYYMEKYPDGALE